MLGKVVRAAKTVHDVATSKDPASAAAKVVRTAVTVSHPVVGAVAGRLIEEGTKLAVNKGIEIANNPEVQAKVKATGKKAVATGKKVATNVGNAASTAATATGKAAANAGAEAARGIRRGAASGVRRLQEFRGNRNQ